MLSEDGLSYASEECFYRVHMLSLQYRNSPDLIRRVRIFYFMIKNTQDVFKKNFSNCFSLKLWCQLNIQKKQNGSHLKREAAIKKSMLVGGDERQREN